MLNAQLEFFHELGEFAYANYPSDVWINSSTLVRAGIVGPRASAPSTSLRTRLRGIAGLDWNILRTSAKKASSGLQLKPHHLSVLCSFPFRRRDYEGLLRPLLCDLSEAGIRCGVVTTAAELRRWRANAETDGTTAVAIEAGGSPQVYREARRQHRELRGAVRDMQVRFASSPSQRRRLAAYFSQFVLDKALFSHCLERLGPRVVLGLHFAATRGFQAAIRQVGASEHGTRVLLMQHGAFSANEGFHDFEGADVALLWGDRWRRELAGLESKPYATLPEAIVVGNPKYDRDIRSHVRSSGADASPQGRVRVLYISTHDGNHRTIEPPLEWLFGCASSCAGFDLMIKPHPAESLSVIRARVERGLISPEAVLPPASDVMTWVGSADIVVGTASTALFEAALVRKPVILLATEPNHLYDGFVAAKDQVELSAVLRRWQGDPDAVQSVLEYQDRLCNDIFGLTREARSVCSALIASYLG